VSPRISSFLSLREPAKRAIDIISNICRPLCGLARRSVTYLGFRFASPEALRYRLLRRLVIDK